MTTGSVVQAARVGSKEKHLTYTFVEAAGELGCSPKTVSRMVARRQIKTVVIGNTRRIPVSELERLGRGGK